MTIIETHPSGRSRSPAPASSTAVFVVLRRMRAPLIVLICSFAVSVFGLTLMPGVDAQGRPWRMDAFDAFYFMSYTASTIGYGEIPQPFSTAQRLWVTIAIYLTVIAWAYAIATVFGLVQDRAFRGALAEQRFERVVRRIREPFILMVGYGQAGELLTRALDALDHRVVVLDGDQDRIDALDLGAFRSDVPGYAGDARSPDQLIRAGLGRPNCEAVVAVTGDDETNLAVVMAASLLHPEVQVVAFASTHAIAERMRAFGDPGIVDPYDLFGDELMTAARAPHLYRLIEWLTAAPGLQPPPVPKLPTAGRWVVAGYGGFGSHLAHDLRANNVDVTAIDPGIPEDTADAVATLAGSATDPRVLAAARLDEAVGFAAATNNDTSNLSLIVAARRINPELFLVARQNRRSSAALFAALDIDAVLIPNRLVAHEVLARIGSPMLWRFLQEARRQPDEWARDVLQRLVACDQSRRPELWRVTVDDDGAPALADCLARGTQVRLGTLLHDPEDRDRPLDLVVLLRQQASGVVSATPDGETVLSAGDQLLLAGTPAARRALDTTVSVPPALAYVLSGRRVGSGWLWRTLANHG